MHREDKIALVVIVLIICGVGFGLMLGVQYLGNVVFGWFAAGSAGIGWRTAFIAALAISFVVIVLFALVSGGGDLLGELPFVLIGFFVLLGFFTVSLALLF